MIFRRRQHEVYSKLHLSLLSLHRVLRPWTKAKFGQCQLKEFLCPRIRNFDWRIITANGDDIEKWFRQNGKGSMLVSAYLAHETNNAIRDVWISFTDPNTALMCKLQLGGQ